MKFTLKISIRLLLVALLILSNLKSQCQSPGFETKILLSEKLRRGPEIELGVKLDEGSGYGHGITYTKDFGSIYAFQLIYKTNDDTSYKELITIKQGNQIFFADPDYLNRSASRIMNDTALISVGTWGINLPNNNYNYPQKVKINPNEDLSVSKLIKKLVYEGSLVYDQMLNPRDIKLVTIGDSKARDSILTSLEKETHEKRSEYLFPFIYFLWNQNSPTLGVKLPDNQYTNHYGLPSLTIERDEFVVEPINNLKISDQKKYETQNKKEDAHTDITDDYAKYCVWHSIKKSTDLEYNVAFKKKIVYDLNMQLPKPYSFYVNKDIGMFNYYLSDSLNKIWSLYPNDTIYFTRRNSKSKKTIYVSRRIISKKYVIFNIKDSDKDEIPKFYYAYLKQFVPLQEKIKPKKINGVPKKEFFLWAPYKHLPQDSLYIKIIKPFGYTINNTDNLSRFNPWKKPEIFLNCWDSSSFTLRWVTIPYQTVFYFDLSDAYQRKSTIDLLQKEFNKIKKRQAAFVIYISNLNNPFIITGEEDIGKAMNVIRNIEPFPPKTEYDINQLSKDVVSNRSPVYYYFFLSESTIESSGIRLITKFLMQEYGLLATGLNQDDLNKVLKQVNKNRQKAWIKIYIHNRDVHLQNLTSGNPEIENIKFINWEN